MQLQMKRTFILSSIAFFILLVILVSIHSFSIFDCSHELKVEELSPDKLFIASVSENDCGATTDYSTWVTVRKSSERLDLKKQRPVLVIEGKNNVSIKWPNKYSLLIRFTNSKVFHQDKMFENILISYEVK
jgi:hypothetical protein